MKYTTISSFQRKCGTKATTIPKSAIKICSPFRHHPKIFFQRFKKKSYLFNLKLQKNCIKLKFSFSTYLILIQLLVWKNFRTSLSSLSVIIVLKFIPLYVAKWWDSMLYQNQNFSAKWPPKQFLANIIFILKFWLKIFFEDFLFYPFWPPLIWAQCHQFYFQIPRVNTIKIFHFVPL